MSRKAGQRKYSKYDSYFLKYVAHRISHGKNDVVVSIQSNNSKKLLFADWLFTTTLVLWDILWAMLMQIGLFYLKSTVSILFIEINLHFLSILHFQENLLAPLS